MKYFWLLMVLGGVMSSLAQSPERGEFDDYQLQSSGISREYRVYVPASYDPAQATPVVFMMHGLTSNIDDIEDYTEISQKADEAGFLVVYPQALGGQFAIWLTIPKAFLFESPDMRFIRDIWAEVQSHYTVAPQRIYALGYSNGSGMGHRMVCEMSDVFAALGSVGGTYIGTEPCTPDRPIPVMVFHAKDDPTVPYDGIPFIFQSTPNWAEAWARRNHCETPPQIEIPQAGVNGQAWRDCADGAEVIFYTLDEPTHNYPGGGGLPAEPIPFEAVRANDYIWDFFTQHPKHIPSLATRLNSRHNQDD